jgi:hypothetical protein
MAFKKITGEFLVKSIKDGKLRELKSEIDEELVEKVTDRITKRKKDILEKIRNKRGGKK